MRVRGWSFAPSVLYHYHHYLIPMVMAKPQPGSFMPAYLNIWTRLRSRHVFAFHVSLPVGDISTFLVIAHSPDTIIPPQNKPQPLGSVGIVHNRGLLI